MEKNQIINSFLKQNKFNHTSWNSGSFDIRMSSLIKLVSSSETLNKLISRLEKDKETLEMYYDLNVLKILHNVKILNIKDIYDYINCNVLSFSKIFISNFLHLYKNNLLSLIEEFDDYFRGDIKSIIKINNCAIIHTINDEGKNNYYSSINCTYVYSSLEECLLNIISPYYGDAMYALWKSDNDKVML